jgi:hypothetical protein
MSKYGPTRGELWFRLGAGVVGLGLVGVMVALRGLPEGPGMVEVLGLPILFFGGTVIWAARRLLRRDHP